MSLQPDDTHDRPMPDNLIALAEVVRLWMPGLKGDPITLAAIMLQNLRKRGFEVVKSS